MVILLSALNGFETAIFSSYTKSDPDLLIKPSMGAQLNLDSKTLNKLKKLPCVSVISKVLKEKAIIQYGEQQTICEVWGVDEKFADRILIDSVVTAGEPRFFDKELEKLGALANMALLSGGLVYKLGVGKIEEPITLMVVDRKAGIHDANALRTADFVPSAIVQLPEEQNDQCVLIGLGDAQELFDKQEGYSQIEIRLKGAFRKNAGLIEQSKREIKNIMALSHVSFEVQTQQEQHPLLYRMFNTEKWISFAILTFVLLLISFNLLGALTLMVLDKKRDFIMFQNIGLGHWGVRWIVFWEGIWISVVGTFFGLAVGLAIVILQTKFGWVTTQGTFTIPYPVEIRWMDFVLIFGLNVFLGCLSALIPAWKSGNSYVADARIL